MILYRLCEENFADSIDGTGAKLYGGRWNSVGRPMLYTAGHISLAVLEILVRTPLTYLPENHVLVKIELSDKIPVFNLQKSKLKKNWKNDIAYSRFIGDSFLSEQTAVVMRTPSAVVDDEDNFLFNPLHPHFSQVKIISKTPFQFDKRLFLKNE